MSLLGNATLANEGKPYYGGGGGGGGGGGSNITASTLTVSSITGVTNIDNGLFFPDGADIAFGAAAVSGYQSITWAGNDGIVVGLSTINGAPVLPATGRFGAIATNIYVPAAGTAVPVANFSTVAGHVYQIDIDSLQVKNQPVGAPAAGAWSELVVDTTVPTSLDTFDMAQVSTIANDLLKSSVYTFRATGAAHTLSAQGSLSNTLSTAMTFPGQMTLRDLGLLSGMPVVG